VRVGGGIAESEVPPVYGLYTPNTTHTPHPIFSLMNEIESLWADDYVHPVWGVRPREEGPAAPAGRANFRTSDFFAFCNSRAVLFVAQRDHRIYADRAERRN
jgi:hypothetical protein